jgi:hypothetical protein
MNNPTQILRPSDCVEVNLDGDTFRPKHVASIANEWNIVELVGDSFLNIFPSVIPNIY